MSYLVAPMASGMFGIPYFAGMRNRPDQFLMVDSTDPNLRNGAIVAVYTVDPVTGFISGPGPTTSKTVGSIYEGFFAASDGSFVGWTYHIGNTFAFSLAPSSRVSIAPFNQTIAIALIEPTGPDTVAMLGGFEQSLPAAGGNWTVPATACIEGAGPAYLSNLTPLPRMSGPEPPSNLAYRLPNAMAMYGTGSTLSGAPSMSDLVVVLRVRDCYTDFPPQHQSDVGYTVLMKWSDSSFVLLTDLLPGELLGLTGAPFDDRTGYCSVQEWLVGTGPFPSPSVSYLAGDGNHYYVANTVYDHHLSPTSFMSIFTAYPYGFSNRYYASGAFTPDVVWAQNGSELWYFQFLPARGVYWFGPPDHPDKVVGQFPPSLGSLSVGTFLNNNFIWEEIVNVYPTVDGVEVIAIVNTTGERTYPNRLKAGSVTLVRLAVGFDGSLNWATRTTGVPYPSSGFASELPPGVTNLGTPDNPNFPMTLGTAQSGLFGTLEPVAGGPAPTARTPWPNTVLVGSNLPGQFGPMMLWPPDLPDFTVTGVATVPRSAAEVTSTSLRTGKRVARSNTSQPGVIQAT